MGLIPKGAKIFNSLILIGYFPSQITLNSVSLAIIGLCVNCKKCNESVSAMPCSRMLNCVDVGLFFVSAWERFGRVDQFCSDVPVRLTRDVPRCKLSASRCNRGSFFDTRYFSRGKSSLDLFSFLSASFSIELLCDYGCVLTTGRGAKRRWEQMNP